MSPLLMVVSMIAALVMLVVWKNSFKFPPAVAVFVAFSIITFLAFM